MDEIKNYLSERIAANDFPSAVFLVAEKGEIVLLDAAGFAVVEPERIEANVNTIYDVASLTKPLVTGLLMAKLIEEEKLPLNGRVGVFLKEFDTEGKRAITILDLLTHRSHLPAWKPFYLCVADAADVIGEIGRTPLDFEAEAVTYSDLNFIALGTLIERLGQASLAGLTADILITELNLQRTFFNPPESFRGEIAASEKGNEFERQMCIEKGYRDIKNPVATALGSDPVIWGRVHDGNAAFMGGASGHAGLFSTARDVFEIAQQFLPSRTSLLKPETCKFFRTNFTEGINEDRSFAFQLASTKDSSAGTRMSPQSFGHNGFTGTSLWIDPVKE